MRAVAPEAEVYLWLGAMDMRVSFDRLAEFIKAKLQRTPMAGGLYVFLSRRRERVRILYWDRDGYAIWYKRLEAGAFRVESREGYEQLTGVDLEQLLQGIDLSRIKLRQSAEKGLYS